MRTIKKTVYKFAELGKEVQGKVIENFYVLEDYPFLEDYLNERLVEILKENNITIDNVSINYSLSYSQGDGFCFMGEFEKDNKTIKITKSNYNYSHYKTVNIDIYKDDEDGYRELEDEDEDYFDNFKALYKDICYALEKIGYAEIEFKMSSEDFADFSDSNEYEYFQDGTLL